MVLDADARLYAIAERLYTGLSLNNADNIARKLLPPAATIVRQTRRPLRERHHYANEEFDIALRPVLGGRDGTPIAILACYARAGSGFTPPPLVAAWEWQEPPPGSGGPFRHWWSEHAPGLYGVAPPQPGWTGGPSGRDPFRFINDILVDEGRVPTTAIMQEFRNAAVDQPIIRIMEQRNAATGEYQVIRAVGWKSADRLYCGFSMRVRAQDLEHELHSPLRRQLTGLSAIITDPLMVVDTTYDAIVMTSDDYLAADLHLPEDRALAAVVRAESLDAVLRLIHDAATRAAHRVPPVPAAVRRQDGSWWHAQVHAVGISDSANPHSRFILCRLAPAEDRHSG
ncbi:hypothetical protein [Amycolatopsis sp. NBC_01480]|uniref:hypothetical protein n=1 Tax=Amycolatopsis sp. NBC_01480 TaxID=2903562 RepID=UPI002E2B8432|nr:hypothetical protein [Amycolatopsis sp. NBC_01480]